MWAPDIQVVTVIRSISLGHCLILLSRYLPPPSPPLCNFVVDAWSGPFSSLMLRRTSGHEFIRWIKLLYLQLPVDVAGHPPRTQDHAEVNANSSRYRDQAGEEACDALGLLGWDGYCALCTWFFPPCCPLCFFVSSAFAPTRFSRSNSNRFLIADTTSHTLVHTCSSEFAPSSPRP